MNLAKTSGRASFVVLSLAALWVTTLSIAGISLHTLPLMMLVLILVLPMGLRHIQGRLDLLEPLVLANVALSVMFIGRPLADLATGSTLHLGVDITATFDEALFVALAGVLAFQLGYHSPFARKWSGAIHAPAAFRPDRAAILAWIFFVLGAGLFGAFLESAGGLGLLIELLKGRSSEDNAIFEDASGYLYNGILLLAASALIFFALASVLKRRIYFLWFAAMALPLLIFFGARGTRSELLPLILAVPTFWYLWKNRRPSMRFLFVTMVIGIALIGWQREIRVAGTANRAAPGDALVEALSSPLEQFGDILSGSDDEMFDSIANELHVVPQTVGYRPGGSLTDLLIRMIPHAIWPNKPLETNDAVVDALWPAHYAKSRGSAAFSIMGPFYADSGFIGVVLGMYGIGVALSALWRWYLRYSESLNATLVYSMCLPFVVILMRGTLPGVFSRMLFMVIPLVILTWLSRLTIRSIPGKRMHGHRIEREKHAARFSH